MSDIDWNVELRKIEREYDGLPPEETTEQRRIRRDAEQRRREREEAARGALGVFLRTIPVLGLAVAIVWWPYAASCGLDLAGYLSAVAMLALGGLWLTTCTWRQRMAVMHALALLVVLWALALASLQVLPRVGYARAQAGWRCGR